MPLESIRSVHLASGALLGLSAIMWIGSRLFALIFSSDFMDFSQSQSSSRQDFLSFGQLIQIRLTAIYNEREVWY